METQSPPNPKMKRGPKPKRKKEMAEHSTSDYNSNAPSPPRTRSQVAPDWTTKESLILVNEIAAVESDCLKALASYQKWKIIVQNCSVLDVSRTLNQCRSKWNSLLADYNCIKQWESKSNSDSDSYWLLASQNRIQFRLPQDFDYDLFRAIDGYVRAQKDHPDTDPDTDPEAEADLLDVIAKLGSKRHRRRSMSLKIKSEEKALNCCTEEQTQIINHGEEPQQSYTEENPQMCIKMEKPEIILIEEEPQESHVEEKFHKSCPTETPLRFHAEEKPLKSLVQEKPKSIHTRKKKIAGTDENEQMMVEKLHENPELIQDVVQGNLHEIAEFGGRDLTPQKSLVGEKTKSIRTRKKKIAGTEEKKQMMVEKLHGTAELIHDVVQGNLHEMAEFGGSDSTPQKSLVEEKPKTIRARKKKTTGTEEMMAEKLRSNAELIHAIIQANPPKVAGFGSSDLKSEDFQTDFIRRQGDKLIAYLGDIVNILDQFPYLVQKCE